MNQLIHPRAVIKQKYNGHRLDEEIVRSILTFSFFFAITICAIALALSLLGLDWMTALTGAASTVSGVGPGLGETIGPAGNFASLPDAAGRRVIDTGKLFLTAVSAISKCNLYLSFCTCKQISTCNFAI